MAEPRFGASFGAGDGHRLGSKRCGGRSFNFQFPLRWIPRRALPTAAASCFSRRRPPLRPSWLRRSFRMSSRLSPISASLWSSWGAGESGRGALRALGLGTPPFLLASVVTFPPPPKKNEVRRVYPPLLPPVPRELPSSSPPSLRALQGTLSPPPGRFAPSPRRFLARLGPEARPREAPPCIKKPQGLQESFSFRSIHPRNSLPRSEAL